MSVLPAKTKLTAFRGGTYTKTWTLHTGDTVDSPAQDLTDYTARLLVKDNQAETLLDLTTENGGLTLGDSEGTILAFISDEDTAAATWDFGRFLLTITDPAGNTDPLLYGGFVLRGW